jgi:hypothetical protein
MNDDERDYAEERANLADLRREHEQEAAFEALTGRLASTLRELSLDAHDTARASIGRLIEEVDLRLPPNVHRYELLARAQHTATLAATIATSVDGFAGYDLLAGARAVAAGYRTTHTVERILTADGARFDLTERGLNGAIDRVIGVVQSFLDDEEQREQDARDAADHAETEAYLLRVTR